MFVPGAHAPSKPHVNVIGRNELYVSWGPPEVPLGRLNRYDVIMNDKIIYSGNDLNIPVRRLTPDTEYSFVVSEGTINWVIIWKKWEKNCCLPFQRFAQVPDNSLNRPAFRAE